MPHSKLQVKLIGLLLLPFSLNDFEELKTSPIDSIHHMLPTPQFISSSYRPCATREAN